MLAGLVMLTDAVADQLEGGLLDSAALASFLSESEREHYAESLSQPLRNLQSGLLKLGPVLPNQLVAQLQQLVDNTINTPLGLEGADRVDVRGTIPDIENLPASPTTYWLELDFSGLSTSVSLPLPIDSLVSSALGVTLDDLPELSANLTAELQGGLRFGIDLATTVPSQALLLDTNGDLEAFDGTRAELLADFSADLSLDPASQPDWLEGIDLTELVRLEGDAYLDLVSLADDPRLPSGVLPLAQVGDSLDIRGDADLNLHFAIDGDAGALLESFGQAISDELSALGEGLDIGSLGDCPASWLAFVDRFIALVGTLSERVDQLPAPPDWLPDEAVTASRSLATGLQTVAGQLERFRSEVLDAENFVSQVNDLFADAGLSLRLRLLAQPSNPETDCCDQSSADSSPLNLLRSFDLDAFDSTVSSEGTLRITLPEDSTLMPSHPDRMAPNRGCSFRCIHSVVCNGTCQRAGVDASGCSHPLD